MPATAGEDVVHVFGQRAGIFRRGRGFGLLVALGLSASLFAAYGLLSRPAALPPPRDPSAPPPKPRKMKVHKRAAAPATRGPEKIIVVMIDSLRRDHLGVHGYSRPVSPALDRLAAEGLHLANMIAPSSQTVPSTAAMLTSLLPHQLGIQFYSRTQAFTPTKERAAPKLGGSVTTMAEHFSAHGFYTAAVVANPWLTAPNGFAQGFEWYAELNFEKRGGAFVFDGRVMNDEAKRLLSLHRDEKTLLYLHYMDVHYPYAANPRVRPVFRTTLPKRTFAARKSAPPDDTEYVKACYDDGILYMDELLGDLRAFLEREGLDADTTLVVTSDHGDEFREHGGTGHGTTLYAELVNTFAVFWNARRFPPARVDRYTESIDILPTLLEAYGIPRAEALMGRSTLGASRPQAGGGNDRAILSELGDRKAILSGGWKYLVDLDTGSEELYDVGPRGAIERENRIARADIVAPLRERLAPIVRLARSRAPALAGMDQETEEKLKALGYLN